MEIDIKKQNNEINDVKKEKRNKIRFIIEILTILIMLIGIGFQAYFSDKDRGLTREIAEASLFQHFYKEFYLNNNFQQINNDISLCKDLDYNSEDINLYLGFLDDIGFYYNKKLISRKVAEHLFGSVIVLSYNNNQIKEYLKKSKKQFSKSLVSYERIAKDLQHVDGFSELLTRCQ